VKPKYRALQLDKRARPEFNMSRLSRVNVKARESVFAIGPEHYIGDTQARCPPDLQDCVTAMEDCCEEVWHFMTSGSFCSLYSEGI
jgi:hypothetical protein